MVWVVVAVWDAVGVAVAVGATTMEDEMMKQVKKEVEIVDGEGLTALIGENVLLMCANYFYAGVLTGVNDTCVELEDAGIVYETGALSGDKWKDCQQLPGVWYVQTAAIESFGRSGR